MKNLFVKFALIAGVMASPSFAIFGLGFHYAPSLGTIDANTTDLSAQLGDGSSYAGLDLIQEEGTIAQGAGVKFWIDVIPFIDIEATSNVHFGNYKANLTLTPPSPGEAVVADIDPSFGGIAISKYFQSTTDLSINYPFLDLPIIDFYAGAGMSFFFATPLIDDELVSALLEANPSLIEDLETNPNGVAQEIADQLVDRGLDSSVGGHVLLGTRAKIPVIPFAAYANAKYYFGGDFNPAVQQGAVFELGVGLAI